MKKSERYFVLTATTKWNDLREAKKTYAERRSSHTTDGCSATSSRSLCHCPPWGHNCHKPVAHRERRGCRYR